MPFNKEILTAAACLAGSYVLTGASKLLGSASKTVEDVSTYTFEASLVVSAVTGNPLPLALNFISQNQQSTIKQTCLNLEEYSAKLYDNSRAKYKEYNEKRRELKALECEENWVNINDEDQEAIKALNEWEIIEEISKSKVEVEAKSEKSFETKYKLQKSSSMPNIHYNSRF